MSTDARHLSPDEQREKRRTALRMRTLGYTFAEIAEVVSVNIRTVQDWDSVAKLRGKDAAIEGGKRGVAVGSGRTLSSLQELCIQDMMKRQLPDEWGLSQALWTRAAVGELIQQKYGLTIPVRTLGEYLKRWQFTPQKPLKRAYEQNPTKVQEWLDTEYPRIAQEAKTLKAEIHWGDETGLRSDHQAGRSYAPVGETPVRLVSGSRFSLNMISSVTNQGKLRFMLYEETMTADVFITFLRRLLKEAADRTVFLIVDNLKVHHSKKVQEWLEQNPKLKLFYLPTYAPELNPDEYLNCDLKHQVRTGKAARNRTELKRKVRSAMKRLQLRPQRVKSYFKHRHIAYAA